MVYTEVSGLHLGLNLDSSSGLGLGLDLGSALHLDLLLASFSLKEIARTNASNKRQ